MKIFSFFKKAKVLRRKKNVLSVDKKLVTQQWQEVEEQIKLGKPSNWKSALIAADKILYFVLGKMGYQGTLGEKLIAAREKFSNYQGVWSAHKLRNRLVHEVNHEFFVHEAKQAIEQYKQALKDLEGL